MLVKSGESKPFTIKPDKCYKILDVKVDGKSKGKISEYTFPGVTEKHTIHAEFCVAVPGDLNCSGTADLSDAISALRILSGIDTGNTKVFADADINGDGRIGIEEVVYILQKVSELR